MTNEQLRAFDKLRAAWVAHHDLQTQHAPVADLMSSRLRLDGARAEALRHLH